jgi:hypothetical protein
VTVRSLFFPALAIAAMLAPAPALASIVTDRPDVAESSLSVLSGAYQIEQAAQFEASGADGSLVFPSLHRVGLGNGLEFRVETPIVRLQNAAPSFEDLAIGTKWHFMDGGGWGERPSMALLAHAIFDGQGRAEPLAKLALDTTLPFETDLGVNLSASLPPENGPAYAYAFSLNHTVFGPLDAYAEISGTERPAAPAATERGIDGGLKLLVTPDAQLDLAVFHGISAGSPDWYITSGLSVVWGQR